MVVNQWNGIGNVTCGSDANPAICNPTTGQLIIDSFEYDYVKSLSMLKSNSIL